MAHSIIEDIIRIAKEREEAAKKEKTEAVVSEIEQGALAHREAKEEDATWTAKVEEIDGEIKAIQESIEALASGRAQIEANEDLKKHPDLQAQAFEGLRAEEEELRVRLEYKQREKSEAEKLQTAARAKTDAVEEKAKPYLTEREVPPEKLDEIWRYVEYERDIENFIKREDIAQFGRYEAEGHIYKIADQGDMRGEHQKALQEEDIHSQYWGRLFKKPLGGFRPEMQPKICNAFVAAFEDKIRQTLQERTFQATGYSKEIDAGKPLNDEQLRALEQAKLSLVYKGGTMPLWDGGNPVPRREEPLPEFFAQLTPNEQVIVRNAVHDRNKRKENLLAELKLSEYEPEADQYLRDAAAAEDAEYNRQKFAEKEPEIEGELKRINQEQALKEKELADLEELQKRLAGYEKLHNQAANLKYKLEHYSNVMREAQADREQLQRQRDALPKKIKVPIVGGLVGLDGGPKDKEQDRNLAAEIREVDASLQRASALRDKTQAELRQLEPQLEAEKQAMLKLDNEAFDGQGNLTLKQYQIDDRISDTKSEIQEIQKQREITKKTRELWEQGKYLDFSMREMRFVAPKKGASAAEIDWMADAAAAVMIRYFDQYSLWRRLPETEWTVKDGILTQTKTTSHEVWKDWYGEKMSGEWKALANLHSENLSPVLSEKVRQLLAQKFGAEKISGLKITVE